MKPTNLPSTTCTNQSSNCVTWGGPNISCINLCTGDSITWAIYNLATELCKIMDQLNLDNYDLQCLATDKCATPDFKALVQLIIDKVCALSGTPALTASSFSSSTAASDPIVTFVPYFRYTNPANGDVVVEGPLTDYVQRIASTVAALVGLVNTQSRAIGDLNTRVTALESNTPAAYQLPSLFPTYIGNPNISLPLDQFTQLLEQSYGQLATATGNSTQIYSAIADNSIANLKNEDQLGLPGAKMGSITDWVGDVKNAADSMLNMWLTIMDLRRAVKNIQLNCCNTTCNDISVDLQVTMPTSDTLKFYLTGTIPAIFQNCIVEGTLFKIADQSGNYINATINVVANLNDPNGFTVSIAGSPLNVADDFTITATLCLMNTENNSVCQSVLEYYLVNTVGCPVVTWTPGETTMTYSFNHSSGALTYSVQLFDSGNNMVASQNFAVTGPIAISGVFNGLTANTVYKGRVQMITLNHTKTCPFTVVTTSAASCPAPQEVTAIITIP